MAFIRVPFSAGKELPLAEKGEYELVIKQFKAQTSAKTGRQYFNVTFGFTNGEHPDFRQNFFFPVDGDKPDTATRFAQEVRRLFKAFELPMDEGGEDEGFDDADVIGATAKVWVYTATEEDRDGNEVIVQKARMPKAAD